MSKLKVDTLETWDGLKSVTVSAIADFIGAIGSAIGYGPGAGGAVTQTASKTTTVAINKPSGRITTHNAAMSPGATVSFQVNNTSVKGFGVLLTIYADGSIDASRYRVELAYAGVNSFVIRLTNISGETLAQAVPIDFVVIKGSTF